MTIAVSPVLLSTNELSVVVETGLYVDEEAFLSDAVRTLLAARPDLREAIACKLYERGELSLGRVAEWAGVSVIAMKEALHRRGIERGLADELEEAVALANEALRVVDSVST